ncbi:MAG: insulinase family protein [Candidatus Nealsonbacteria bacterium]|nr:insulinase family protein [Candidatus Nealsonbacteria bacterium]
MFRKTTLKNGLRIITVPQNNTETVTVLVLAGTGSKYETKEMSGISHFLEHLFFKGTKKQTSPRILAETLDKVGGIYNAFTSEECTGFFAKVEASHFELALDWVSDIFLNSLLPEKEIEKEKGVVIEEINMYRDHPMNYIHTLWTKLLYGDQPAGWDVAGSKETVLKITRQNLIDYVQNHYTASNTVICIAGKIEESNGLALAEKYFSKINTAQALGKLKVVEGQNRPECLIYYKKTDQTHFCLGVRGYNLSHPQKYSQELLATILGAGGMMSNRLFTELREKLGLAYYVRTEADANPDTGFLVTNAGVDNTRVEKSILTILKEYKKISQIKVPLGELKKAKDNIKGKMAIYLETSDSQSSFYGLQEILERKILTPKELFKRIDKVSQNDILKVAKDIFRPERLNLALIGPFGDKAKFEKLLKF